MVHAQQSIGGGGGVAGEALYQDLRSHYSTRPEIVCSQF